MSFQCLSVLLYLLMFSRLVIPAESRITFTENAKNLKVSGANSFPVGKYENIEILIFCNNNFTVLKTFIFYYHRFGNVKTVDLSNSSISVIEPYAFQSMSKLIKLNLFQNNLTNLTNNSFYDLTTLEDLNLGNNQIQFIHAQILAPLISLKSLDLSQNNIRTLEVNLIKNIKTIQKLNLEKNPLILPEKNPILESGSLIELILARCSLQIVSSEAFTLLPNLQSLDLSVNDLKVLPSNLLKTQINLQYLDVSDNLLDFIGKEVFHSPSCLKKLDYEGNSFKDNPNYENFLKELCYGSNDNNGDSVPSTYAVPNIDLTTKSSASSGDSWEANHQTLQETSTEEDETTTLKNIGTIELEHPEEKIQETGNLPKITKSKPNDQNKEKPSPESTSADIVVIVAVAIVVVAAVASLLYFIVVRNIDGVGLNRVLRHLLPRRYDQVATTE